MAPVRQFPPGKFWFVTSRTLESMFLLRPDPEAVQIMGFLLARSLRLYPGISCHGVVGLSNHPHLIVRDDTGDMSDFGEYFFGNLAREINHLRGRDGTVFPRPFSGEEILDDTALAERMAYLLLNPAADRLTQSYKDWPGLVAWQRYKPVQEFRRIDRRSYDRARRSAELGSDLRPEDFMETELLCITPLPEELEVEAIERAVLAEEARLRIRKPGVLGRAKIVSVDPRARPRNTKKEPRPLVHASSRAQWLEYREKRKAFLVAYFGASRRFRAGERDVPFPPWTFRPSTKVGRGVPVLSSA